MKKLELKEFKKVEVVNLESMNGGVKTTVLDGVLGDDFTDGGRLYCKKTNGNFVDCGPA